MLLTRVLALLMLAHNSRSSQMSGDLSAFIKDEIIHGAENAYNRPQSQAVIPEKPLRSRTGQLNGIAEAEYASEEETTTHSDNQIEENNEGRAALTSTPSVLNIPDAIVREERSPKGYSTAYGWELRSICPNFNGKPTRRSWTDSHKSENATTSNVLPMALLPWAWFDKHSSNNLLQSIQVTGLNTAFCAAPGKESLDLIDAVDLTLFNSHIENTLRTFSSENNVIFSPSIIDQLVKCAKLERLVIDNSQWKHHLETPSDYWKNTHIPVVLETILKSLQRLHTLALINFGTLNIDATANEIDRSTNSIVISSPAIQNLHLDLSLPPQKCRLVLRDCTKLETVIIGPNNDFTDIRYELNSSLHHSANLYLQIRSYHATQVPTILFSLPDLTLALDFPQLDASTVRCNISEYTSISIDPSSNQPIFKLGLDSYLNHIINSAYWRYRRAARKNPIEIDVRAPNNPLLSQHCRPLTLWERLVPAMRRYNGGTENINSTLLPFIDFIETDQKIYINTPQTRTLYPAYKTDAGAITTFVLLDNEVNELWAFFFETASTHAQIIQITGSTKESDDSRTPFKNIPFAQKRTALLKIHTLQITTYRQMNPTTRSTPTKIPPCIYKLYCLDTLILIDCHFSNLLEVLLKFPDLQNFRLLGECIYDHMNTPFATTIINKLSPAAIMPDKSITEQLARGQVLTPTSELSVQEFESNSYSDDSVYHASNEIPTGN
ncbi:hypothetical protein NEHOM01_1217 [Nematocida homosporus]|uniref:uncharacterized protein n=1 Tax=Nematocida homosporus TaxID=1912981 RepID=UPI00221EDBE5|nr:uncharacterized protein NEHOM01_1217 [Nematocida homosporus]KAI5186014.1 hypothetical protein NEHOM01_1217 [Nematocida homosporus]